MTTTPDNAALTIAKWLWPTATWRPSHLNPEHTVYGRQHHAKDSPETFRDYAWSCINDAERAMIERGLAEEYGEALSAELLGHDSAGEPYGVSCYSDAAKLATAPLDARVRALVSVIEQQEKKA